MFVKICKEFSVILRTNLLSKEIAEGPSLETNTYTFPNIDVAGL